MTAALGAWRPAAVLTAAPAGSRLRRYLIGFFGAPAVDRGAMLGWRVPPGLLRPAPPRRIQAEGSDGRRPGRARLDRG
jgi:hypothetical protein